MTLDIHRRIVLAAPVLIGLMLAAPAPVAAQPRAAPTGSVQSGVDAWAAGLRAEQGGDVAGARRLYAQAIALWQAAADRGDPDAQFDLAQAYKLGRGVPQDLTKAEALYAKAAAQGHLQAADTYGLLLFQRGEHERAMPYVRAASDRGDPRAQYLLGLALFNGDGVAKDWVRAYALVSLAQQQGLPQARQALGQMDQFIPLEQRQQGAAMAPELAAAAEANRNRQVASADLGVRPAMSAKPQAATVTLPRAPMPSATRPPAQVAMAGIPAGPRPPAYTPTPLPGRPATAPALSSGSRLASSGQPTGVARTSGLPGPGGAGADYARPASTALPPAAQRPAPRPVPQPSAYNGGGGYSGTFAAPGGTAPAPSAAGTGAWRIQLGAFGVPANADAQWAKVRGRPELAGHARMNAPGGKVTRLLATGYAEADAHRACQTLSAAGISCLVTRN